MKEVVRTCEEFTAKLDMHPSFNLIGGDPILAPDFCPLVEYLHEKGYSYSVAGNPFHLTDDVLKRLEKGLSESELVRWKNVLEWERQAIVEGDIPFFWIVAGQHGLYGDIGSDPIIPGFMNMPFGAWKPCAMPILLYSAPI